MTGDLDPTILTTDRELALLRELIQATSSGPGSSRWRPRPHA